MSNLNGREVTLIRLNKITHVVGVGQLGPAIDKNSAAKNGLGSLTMFKVEDGVHLVGKNWEAFIPNGNIISALLAPETKAKG